MSMPKYSVIIPVYNRPQEIEELLQSLTTQSFKNFEVLIVEDGSTKTSEAIYEKYSAALAIRYFFKQNSGPGPSRNYGFANAKGDYFVVFDSDCVVPSGYFEAVETRMADEPLDMWGGPDSGRVDFTPLQQAMAYTMSSVLTTGGIRGASKNSFQPRSFNMGLSRKVFEATQGFRFDRFAEDIELSIRASKLGFRVGLIGSAFVYHKRRTKLGEFFGQVSNFGKGRVLVGRVHPDAIRVTHWFPAFFLMGLIATPILLVFVPVIGAVAVVGYVLYLVAIFVDSFRTVGNLWVAILSVPSAVVQLTGYGYGFMKAFFRSS
jgi:cellulose synthase/poly-beta-1,6-N-acetylglucosamine synthase-like glycosyltransferase